MLSFLTYPASASSAGRGRSGRGSASTRGRTTACRIAGRTSDQDHASRELHPREIGRLLAANSGNRRASRWVSGSERNGSCRFIVQEQQLQYRRHRVALLHLQRLEEGLVGLQHGL
jgi:hypothetical protein